MLRFRIELNETNSEMVYEPIVSLPIYI